MVHGIDVPHDEYEYECGWGQRVPFHLDGRYEERLALSYTARWVGLQPI